MEKLTASSNASSSESGPAPAAREDERPEGLSPGRSLLRRAARRLFGWWLFDLGAGIYNLMNANPVWQASCARLLDDLPEGAEPVVLDLGIGPGVSAFGMGRRLPGARFVGLDISPHMLETARRNREALGWPTGRLGLLRGDALRLPVASGSVDAAAGHSFLYLLPDHRRALEEACRVVRRGGRAAFLEPYAGRVDWGWLLRRRSARLLVSLTLWRLYNWIHGRFSERSLQAELERAGFTDARTEVTLGGFGIYGRARKP